MRLTGKIAQNNVNELDKQQLSAEHQKIPRIWIVAADERRAKIFRKNGNRLEPLGEALKTENHEHLTNKFVGRVFSSSQPAAHHKFEPHMHVSRLQETSFARKLADWLETAADDGAFDRLVLAASPRLLGALRSTLGTKTIQRIVVEINKDLTKKTELELRKDLAKFISF